VHFFSKNIIEIVIEDFARNGSQVVPLSSIPLQFIAFVQTNTVYCCKHLFNFNITTFNTE